MSMKDDLREIPLTTVTASFIAGLSAGSGLAGAVTTVLGFAGGTGGRRAVLAAWPLVKTILKTSAKDSAYEFAKGFAASAAQGFRGGRS